MRGPDLASGVVAAVAGGFVAAVAAGASLRYAGPIAVALLLAVAVLAVAGWRRSRAEAARQAQIATQAKQAQRTDRERLERHVRRLEGDQQEQMRLLQRLRQSWRAEREWSNEMRAQLQRAEAALDLQDVAASDDVRALVLRAAIELVDAEKGLLVAREDADADGNLDVVLHAGFEHDPSNSAVAQRFARAVLARDEILRDDDPAAPGETESTAADREIETLVAIPLYLRDRFHGVIVCANRPGGFEELGDELLLALGDHAGAALHQGRLQHELGDARRAPVRVLAELAAARDPLLHRETGELAVHAGLLGETLGMDAGTRGVLVSATLLRAVGYLALPERPLLRPGPLTPDERSLVELHPRIGFTVLMQAPALQDVARVVLHHHERFDGTGYPAGLAGEDIPIAARVIAVLEAYGAMTHERPYRDPWTPEQACRELVAAAGSQFDPEIVRHFVDQVRREPRVAREGISAAILDALPFDLGNSVVMAVDGATLLGNHRRLQEDIRAATRHGIAYRLVTIELTELPRVNVENGLEAGDRLIGHAAQIARGAAARVGGTAYRVSGRRLAILVRARVGDAESGLLETIQTEFLDGPAIHAVVVAGAPAESGEALLARARAALREEPRP